MGAGGIKGDAVVGGDVPAEPVDEVGGALDGDAARAEGGDVDFDLGAGMAEGGSEEVGAVVGIGVGEPLAFVGGGIVVGIFAGGTLRGGVVAEVGDAPVVVGDGGIGFLVDPIGEELDADLIELVAGDGGHAAVAVGFGDAAEDDGAGSISGDDEAVSEILGSGDGAVDEAGFVEGEVVVAEPGSRSSAGGSVAVGAVDVEIGADAGFEGVGGFGGADVAGESRGVGGEGVEVAAVVEEGEEIIGAAAEGAGVVELAGVEGEGMAGFGGVADDALGVGVLQVWGTVLEPVSMVRGMSSPPSATRVASV